jgi:hypothetical protein
LVSHVGQGPVEGMWGSAIAVAHPVVEIGGMELRWLFHASHPRPKLLHTLLAPGLGGRADPRPALPQDSAKSKAVAEWGPPKVVRPTKCRCAGGTGKLGCGPPARPEMAWVRLDAGFGRRTLGLHMRARLLRRATNSTSRARRVFANRGWGRANLRLTGCFCLGREVSLQNPPKPFFRRKALASSVGPVGMGAPTGISLHVWAVCPSRPQW